MERTRELWPTLLHWEVPTTGETMRNAFGFSAKYPDIQEVLGTLGPTDNQIEAGGHFLCLTARRSLRRPWRVLFCVWIGSKLVLIINLASPQ